MAKATAGAAYKELKRVGNYIAPQINAGADRLATNARHQKELNAVEKATADKRLDEALKDISVDTEALQAKATGFTSRDDVARDFAYAATERSQMYAEKAREAASNGDWVTMNNYKGKMNKIKGDFKNTVNDEAILKETLDTYRKAWQEGKVDDDDWLDFAESMEKFNYEVSLDDNDNKVIKAIVLDDDGQPELDGSGNPKYIVKKWSDVVNQHDRPYEVVQLEDKQDKKGLIGDMLATMGKRKYDEVTGDYITTKQTWDDEAKKQFKAKIMGIQSSDRMMHSILKQASGNTINKKKNFTDEDKKLVEDFLRFQVKGGYNTEELKQVRSRTPSEIGASEAANRDARKKDDKGGDENIIDAEPMTDSKGDFVTEGDNGYKYTLKTKGGEPIKGIIESNPDAEILSITSSGNDYFAQVRAESTDKLERALDGGTKTDNVKLTIGELNRLARGMGLKTAADLDKYLENRLQSYGGNRNSNKPTAAELIEKHRPK